MEKGHVGLRELVVIILLMLGFVAAVFFLMGQNSGQAGLAGNQEEKNETLPKNSSEPAVMAQQAENATVQPDAVQFNITDKSIGELLDEGLARADSRFYVQAASGEFTIKTFRWTVGKSNESPDSIPVKENDLRALPVRFNGRYIDSLRGFAFKTYEIKNLTLPTIILGTTVFLANSTSLDMYVKNSSELKVEYDPHPEGTQIMEGCKVLVGIDMTTANGAPLRVYDFSCKVMYGASP